MKAGYWIAPAAALALAACGSGDEQSEAADNLATDNMVTGDTNMAMDNMAMDNMAMDNLTGGNAAMETMPMANGQDMNAMPPTGQ
jgi:hypothetical protein